MSDFIIATSSTADIELEYLEKHHIPFIPYSFVLNGKVYVDDCKEETKVQLFESMRDGNLPSTAQIPEYTYYEFFKELMKEGKDVLFLDMSRAVSNSYNNAERASLMIQKEYPNQRFYMMDTRCITAGLAFLVIHLTEMKEQGYSYDECIEWGEKNKLNIEHHFIVDDLQWLRRGGRLSNSEAIVGTLLNIKPILYVPDEGTVVASSKVRGKKTAMLHMVKSIKKDIGQIAGKRVMIYHADCEPDAYFLMDKIKEMYPEIGPITIHMEGPTIGSHVGPGFVAFVYLGDKGRIF